MRFSLHPLDTQLVVAKPIEETPLARIQTLEDAKHLITERKRNGHAALVTITGTKKQEIGIYSRSIIDLTPKFPDLVEVVRSMNVPSGTLLGAELVVSNGDVEKPGDVTRITHSGIPRALELQRGGHTPKLVLFNALVYKGVEVVALPYRDRLDVVQHICAQSQSDSVSLVEVLTESFASAKQRSIAHKWEGLVLYDARAGSSFRLDGNSDAPLRPDGCWKWKQYSEGDFVATDWVPSTSKRFKGLVKDLKIAQYHPVTGELVSWGKVGVGLSAAERAAYTDKALYPMVFEVKFETRTIRNRLIAARILRRRHDKGPRECISPP